MQTCRSCGERNPDRARFCMMCATPLRAVQVGETRKVVTILFADVKGSTAIGERLDPEAVRRVLSTFYTSAREALERHGGTVEKFIGDAVMAVFGVPRAHEDDAARGVRAALALLDVMAVMNAELSERYGAELQLRIGVNTGEVVAGDPGTGSSFVAGDAVNVAARLEQTAEAGTILIGVDTYELARHIAEVEPVEPLTLKGKSEPVPAFRLTGLRASDEPVVSDVPFVGREAELAKLDGMIETLAAGGSGSLALLGPAGIGKTALIDEVVLRSVGRVRLIRCRCAPEGESAALEPIRDLLASALGLGRDAAPVELIDQARAILGGDRSDLVEATLQRLVDDSDTADAAWLLAEVLRGLGERDPTVVAVDDAHHASPAVADLLADVRRRVRDLPVLWLEAYRTDEEDARTPAPADATAEVVPPLEPTEARSLLQAAAPDLPRGVVTEILEAAEGNPLFLLETARLVTQRGDAKVRIPSGIRALLAARFDSLSDTERRVLEVAATFGRTASRDRLEELLGQEAGRLDRLAVKGFLSTTVDLVGFMHGALREVAYAGATKQRRAELHETIADLCERDGEPVEVVAHHLDLSAALSSELGAPDERDRELSGRAAVALAASGRSALGRGDRTTAVATLPRAATRALVAEQDRARTAVGLLAFELGAWDEVADMLEPVQDDPSAWNPLGVALVKRRRDGDLDRGRTLLSKAAAAGDIDAAAALAGSWKTVDDERAYELYLAALDLDPTDPYALGNVLEVEIHRTGDLVPVADRRPALASALLRRRAQALAGEDRPWSFFDLGKFELFLGEDEEAVASFAAAVASSSAAYMLETSAQSLGGVRDACRMMQGYTWSLDLLELGIRARFGEGVGADERVWILVGGSSAEGGGRIAAYREALLGALEGAEGLLVSGGTAQGVSALAADVSAAHQAVRSIGYLPSTLPDDVDTDERYDDLRRTTGDRFSPLEPLTYWRDILDKGVLAADVGVVAIGGGRLSALEMQFALALGARVATLAGSGGAAAAIMRDRTWGTSPGLSEVEPTASALRAFLLPDLD